MSTQRTKFAEELLRRLSATVRSAQLYSPGHPIISRNLDGLRASLQFFHSLSQSVVVGLVGKEIIVDDVPMASAETMGAVVKRLNEAGVERITIDRGVSPEELTGFMAALAQLRKEEDEATAKFPAFEHIRVGRVTVSKIG